MHAGGISQQGAHFKEHQLQSKVKGKRIFCQRSCSAKDHERDPSQQAIRAVGSQVSQGHSMRR